MRQEEEGEAERGGEGGGLTVSFLPMDLLWERERAMLKKDSFLLADGGGDEVLASLPREEGGGGGGEEEDWPRPPERLSTLGELLTVLELWPERAEARGGGKPVNLSVAMTIGQGAAPYIELVFWISEDFDL